VWDQVVGLADSVAVEAPEVREGFHGRSTCRGGVIRSRLLASEKNAKASSLGAGEERVFKMVEHLI
jgi:hypothetical protein